MKNGQAYEANTIIKSVVKDLNENGTKPYQKELKQFMHEQVPSDMTDQFLQGMQKLKDSGTFNDVKQNN